jgi:hypothetical protein
MKDYETILLCMTQSKLTIFDMFIKIN